MTAKWITASHTERDTALYLFKKSFTLNSPAKSFILRISADTRYRLFINGKFCAEGPCQSSEFVKYFEEVDCAEALRLGENEIAVKVFHTVNPDFYGTMPRKDKPALFFEGEVCSEECDFKICSDESFKVFLANHVTFAGRPVLPSVPPFEEVWGEENYTELPCAILYEPNGAELWGALPLYNLEKRPIKMLKAKERLPLKAVKEYYDDNGQYHLVFDALKYTTAMVDFEFLAEKGEKLRISYVECARFLAEDGSFYKNVRDDLNGNLDSDVYDLVTASGKPQTYAPFFKRAFRFINVTLSKKPEALNAFAARYTYDFEESATNGGVGRFECSNPLFNQMWEVGRNTAECTAHEIFVDCAFFEQQQYVGDGRFESIYAWRLSNDSALQRKLIVDTAHSQLPDGQIKGNYPNITTQILTVAAPYYVSLLREYLRFTGDAEFLKSQTGMLDKLLQFYEQYRNCQGLFIPPYGCRFIDWVEGWKIGTPKGSENLPLTVENLMYAAALSDAAEICEAVGRRGLAEEYRSRKADLINCINTHCYDQKLGLYTDAPKLLSYSEHTTVWAVISSAVSEKDATSLIARTLDSSFVARCSFSKNYDKLRAFEKAGLYEKYACAVLGEWEEMASKHCTTWVEDPVSERSECHGWSSVPTYEFSAKVLGVCPAENGFKRVKIQPTTLGLSYAKGRVPTPFGFIDVSWWFEGEKFRLNIASNEAAEMEIVCPSGEKYCGLFKEFSI